jgi:hypothetical protein
VAGCLALGSCPLATLDDYYADLNNARDKDKVLVSDYNLQAYVPVPVEGALPVKEITNREDMVIHVVRKNTEAQVLDGDFAAFVLGSVY